VSPAIPLDNLRSVEVVTAEGKVLLASKEENSDLFWAVRGGGGNFGVATTFEYQLHPVGLAQSAPVWTGRTCSQGDNHVRWMNPPRRPTNELSERRTMSPAIARRERRGRVPPIAP